MDVASAAILGSGHVVISVAKDINSTILAVIAGLAMSAHASEQLFNDYYPTKHPTMADPVRQSEGTLESDKSPVTAALRSPMVCLLCIRAFHAHSKNTEATMQTTVSVRTLIPNTYMLAKATESGAMITIAMILVVSTLLHDI